MAENTPSTSKNPHPSFPSSPTPLPPPHSQQRQPNAKRLLPSLPESRKKERNNTAENISKMAENTPSTSKNPHPSLPSSPTPLQPPHSQVVAFSPGTLENNSQVVAFSPGTLENNSHVAAFSAPPVLKRSAKKRDKRERRNWPMPFVQKPEVPIGYRFFPTDSELILVFLRRKINSECLPCDDILFHDINIYHYHPDYLTASFQPATNDDWYFFTSRDRKYPRGKRPNRTAIDGYWKATRSYPVIHDSGKIVVGHKRALVFYEGAGSKTSWIMHEFTIKKEQLPIVKDGSMTTEKCMKLDECVLCRIYDNFNGASKRRPCPSKKRLLPTASPLPEHIGSGKEREPRNSPRPFVRKDGVPVSYCFFPTDSELILSYLWKKIKSEPLPADDIVHSVNLYDFHPNNLAALFSPASDSDWYFFTPRDRKYPLGSRPNRMANGGFWKAMHRDKAILDQEEKEIGLKNTLVFFEGDFKTKWIMHEFRIKEELRPAVKDKGDMTTEECMKLDDWVLCRIYEVNRSSIIKEENDQPNEENGGEDQGGNNNSIPSDNHVVLMNPQPLHYSIPEPDPEVPVDPDPEVPVDPDPVVEKQVNNEEIMWNHNPYMVDLTSLDADELRIMALEGWPPQSNASVDIFGHMLPPLNFAESDNNSSSGSCPWQGVDLNGLALDYNHPLEMMNNDGSLLLPSNYNYDNNNGGGSCLGSVLHYELMPGYSNQTLEILWDNYLNRHMKDWSNNHKPYMVDPTSLDAEELRIVDLMGGHNPHQQQTLEINKDESFSMPLMNSNNNNRNGGGSWLGSALNSGQALSYNPPSLEMNRDYGLELWAGVVPANSDSNTNCDTYQLGDILFP